MNRDEWKRQWTAEQEYAFQGWDFSHIDGRCESSALPWDYAKIVKEHLKQTDHLLDIGTGGGEFLLSLDHPHRLTTVTELYPPNAELCRKKLSPLGITVVQTYDENKLPFEAETFDIVINRHASFDLQEIKRVLKSGGYFITQQVGGQNNNDLSEKLIENFVPRFAENTLENCRKTADALGFAVEKAEECFPKMKFLDVGALVFFAKIIEWEFPGFNVEACFDRLCSC